MAGGALAPPPAAACGHGCPQRQARPFEPRQSPKNDPALLLVSLCTLVAPCVGAWDASQDPPALLPTQTQHTVSPGRGHGAAPAPP
jgi:hypothetical protein